MSYSLSQINEAVRSDPVGFVQESDAAYDRKIEDAARKIADNLSRSHIVLLSGPSGSGKTTTAKTGANSYLYSRIASSLPLLLMVYSLVCLQLRHVHLFP